LPDHHQQTLHLRKCAVFVAIDNHPRLKLHHMVINISIVIKVIISLLMKTEVKRINRHYSALDIEAARPQTQGESFIPQFQKTESAAEQPRFLRRIALQ
jgi:hypothetical protein